MSYFDLEVRRRRVDSDWGRTVQELCNAQGTRRALGMQWLAPCVPASLQRSSGAEAG